MILILLFFFFLKGGLSSDIEQLRTCNRCHRVFPVLSELFNHVCDDKNRFNTSKTEQQPANPSTSPKSFKSTRHTSFNKSPISSSSRLISPLSRTNSPIEPEHIPTFKRPLYHLNEQEHSSNTAYISLRTPPRSSASIRVHS